jgi:hypothetical protein
MTALKPSWIARQPCGDDRRCRFPPQIGRHSRAASAARR